MKTLGRVTMARRAAYLSIWSDRRLLGMPASRPILVRCAVDMALGRDTAAYADDLASLGEENRDVAVDAIFDACRAAAVASSASVFTAELLARMQ